MAVRLNNQEAGGFKLLEEDAMDDRPCAAVKKFVTSVLDRKDMKDQDVANSFRNLMEYRDWTSSPSACSVATSSSALDGDRLNSPPSPPSPAAMQAATMASSGRDDQRLPNELLDEICEDIGMKEGMELDFVEFLMEQDTNPHAYMTQEAISSSGAFNSAAGSTISTPTGSGSGMGSRTGSNSGSGTGSQNSHKDNISNNNNNNKTNLTSANNNNNDSSKSLTLLGPPVTTAAPNFLFKPNFSHDSDWLSQIPSPIINSSSGLSSGANTVVSSENTSPAQKRLHLSVSTDTSPNKGRSQTPPGFNQPKHNFSAFNSSNSVPDASVGFNHHENSSQSYFKMPPPAGSVMAKRSHSYPQGAPASSPVHSLGSQGSSTSSNQGRATSVTSASGVIKSEMSDKPLSGHVGGDSSDIEDAMGSINNNNQLMSSNNNNNNVEFKKEPSVSPMNDVPSSPCDFAKPGSPSQGMMKPGMPTSSQLGGRDTSVFQRVGQIQSVPPPNVNVKNMQHMQQNRWMNPQTGMHQMDPSGQPPPHPSFYNKTMYPGAPFQQHHPAPMPHPPNAPPPHMTGVRTPVDSPLDQGYFSNESAGNCSNGSAPSPAFTSSSMSSFSSISTMMPAEQQQQQQQQSHHHHHHQQHQHPHHPHHHPHPHHHQQQQQQQQPQKSALMSHQHMSCQQQDGPDVTTGRPPGQKSVHFADAPEGSPPSHPPTPVDVKTPYNMGAGSTPSGNPTPPDCAFDSMECSSQPKGTMPSGKILPRYNHHGMKSGVAPYTVPNSQGQIMGPGVQGYNNDFNNRPSCAMSGGVNNSESCAQPPQQGVGADGMHPGYMSKPTTIGPSGPGGYYMDGNQNMMRVESMQEFPASANGQNPTAAAPPHAMQRDYQMGNPQSRFPPMDHYSMQQQQPSPSEQQMQQQQHANNMQQRQQSQNMAMQSQPQQPPAPSPQAGEQQQQFSSCSRSGQQGQHPHQHQQQPSGSMGSEFGSMHHQTMQISSSNGSLHHQNSFQMPIAMSTPLSNRSNSNPQMMSSGPPNGSTGGYTTPMCPPGYDGSYSHPGHHRPDAMYPQGPPAHQQPMPGGHKGWGPPSGPEELRVQIPPSPMKAGGMPQVHQGLPHMQPSPTPGCAAPMGPSHLQQRVGGPHPDYGPCMGMNCNACKMAQTSGPQGPMGPAPPTPHMCKMNPHPHHPHHSQPPHQGGPPLPHHPVGGLCPSPNCTACKVNQPGRPQMLSSQQKFLQHLIMDESNSAYRSHPLFPLLRDLVIAEANFDNPRFHYQQLLSTLPNDLQKLLQNFLQRNRPSGQYQSNQAVESVIMDGLRLAHTNLVDKIRQRHEMEKMKATTASLRSMEEFCQKFDHSINGPMGRPGVPNGMGTMGMGHPMGAYHHDGSYIQPGMGPLGFRPLKDGPDHMMGEGHMATSSPQANKTESKKHPSLPKEAVAMMMEWLRNHKDNPYPNDDEKAMLIKQTGLSINQINYWFTNARRRILPKWAQCKT